MALERQIRERVNGLIDNGSEPSEPRQHRLEVPGFTIWFITVKRGWGTDAPMATEIICMLRTKFSEAIS